MTALDTPPLPAGLHRMLLEEMSAHLLADPGVLAVWVGGSLARGNYDRLSDIDLRVVVEAQLFPSRVSCSLAELAGVPVLGETEVPVSPAYHLKHALTTVGIFVDLALLPAGVSLLPEHRLVLACRSEEVAARLRDAPGEGAPVHVPITPEALHALLVEFWMTSLKHRKVLLRGLDPITMFGLHAERLLLLRLIHIGVTGADAGAAHFTNIHTMSKLIRACATDEQIDLAALLGAPSRNRGELTTAIERHRAVVAVMGRTLASRFGCAYPVELETHVLGEPITPEPA